MKDEKVDNEVEVLQTEEMEFSPIFSLRHETIRFPAGDVARRDIVDHDDAVGIVPLRWSGDIPEILLINQYRHPFKLRMWEIPAGLIDVEGEDPLETARRELAEEVELQADAYYRLVNSASSPGYSTERLTVFLATDLKPVPVPEGFVREAEEATLQMKWFELQEIVDAVLAGNVASPTLTMGVLATFILLSRGKEALDEARVA